MTSTLLSDNFLKNVRTSARILEAVNHRFRKRIIDQIEDYGSLNPEALSRLLNVKSSLVAQHLDVLRREEIVQYHIEGKQFFYSLNYDKIEKINNAIHGLAEDY